MRFTLHYAIATGDQPTPHPTKQPFPRPADSHQAFHVRQGKGPENCPTPESPDRESDTPNFPIQAPIPVHHSGQLSSQKNIEPPKTHIGFTNLETLNCSPASPTMRFSNGEPLHKTNYVALLMHPSFPPPIIDTHSSRPTHLHEPQHAIPEHRAPFLNPNHTGVFPEFASSSYHAPPHLREPRHALPERLARGADAPRVRPHRGDRPEQERAEEARGRRAGRERERGKNHHERVGLEPERETVDVGAYVGGKLHGFAVDREERFVEAVRADEN